MPNYSLEHIHLNSSDPQKAAAFYEKMLGAKITGSGAMPDGRSNVVVDINGLVHAPVPPETAGHLGHGGPALPHAAGAIDALDARSPGAVGIGGEDEHACEEIRSVFPARAEWRGHE